MIVHRIYVATDFPPPYSRLVRFLLWFGGLSAMVFLCSDQKQTPFAAGVSA
jgi:hypothetical protein